jgi:acyl-CoA thioesterase
MGKEVLLQEKGFHPFGDLIGLVFESCQDGGSRCCIELEEKLLNPHGVVHGGVLYSMADTGMGGALYTLLTPEEICSTIEIKISYYKAVSRGTLICDTHVLHKRKKIASLVSDIYCGEDRVSQATGTYYIFQSKK